MLMSLAYVVRVILVMLLYRPNNMWQSICNGINRTIFIDYIELNKFLPYFKGKPAAIQEASQVLEDIRQQGAIKMDLDPTAQAQPKIAILSATRKKGLILSSPRVPRMVWPFGIAVPRVLVAVVSDPRTRSHWGCCI